MDRTIKIQLQGGINIEEGYNCYIVDSDIDGFELDYLRNNGAGAIAYISLGEAESYRAYWKDLPKDLLLAENPEWPGNYTVKFWDPRWLKVIERELERASDRGFSGVMFDKVDAYEDVSRLFPCYPIDSTRGEMIKLLKNIYRNHTLFDVSINGALEVAKELASEGEVFDILVVEDVVFGDPITGKRNDLQATKEKLNLIKKMKHFDRILLVEYLDDPKDIATFLKVCSDSGIRHHYVANPDRRLAD